jgi:hypothetical protein
MPEQKIADPRVKQKPFQLIHQFAACIVRLCRILEALDEIGRSLRCASSSVRAGKPGSVVIPAQ